jgi:hypothetical protein
MRVSVAVLVGTHVFEGALVRVGILVRVGFFVGVLVFEGVGEILTNVVVEADRFTSIILIAEGVVSGLVDVAAGNKLTTGED